MKKIKFIILVILNIIFTNSIYSQIVEVPVIDNVTVDLTTQKATISWHVNNPSLIDGYIVKRQIFGESDVVDGSFNTVATINDINITTYIDTGTDFGTANPELGSEIYRIAAFTDNAGVIEYSNMSAVASTIYLYSVSFDLCNEQNTLRWTSHNDFGTNFGGYRIYYKNLPADTPTLLTDITTSNDDTTYIHENITPNVDYYYYVQSYNADNSVQSNSNVDTIATTMPAPPTVMNADYASVETYQQVDLAFTVDANAVINSYVLLKSDSLNGTYDTLQTYQPGISSINYTDNIKSSQEIAYYKVISLNTCNIKSRETNVASNILLEAYANADGSKNNTLRWTNYRTWYGGLANYQIYRSIDGSAFQMLTQVSASDTSYTDDVSEFVQPQYGGQVSKGHFCYYVYATEGSGNSYGITGNSKSNVSCAHQETVVHIPTAFNPYSGKSENRSFKPVISFVNDYSLVVYDRWGSIVYKGTDPLEGWNGSLNGQICKKGTYIYYLKYRTKENKLIERSGQINLVY